MVPLIISLLTLLPGAINVKAHPGPSYPKVIGGSTFNSVLKSRSLIGSLKEPFVEKRAPTTNCGPNVGSCDAGYCCSIAGYCGTTIDYCAAPECQLQYGPACDGNIIPAGASTSGIARPKIGNVVYGGLNTAGVQDCLVPGKIALTFDDGPYSYTKDLLDLLLEYGAKATFFITGNNLGKGRIDDCNTGYPQLIKRMVNEGHQVASHTWSHQNLSSLPTDLFNNQIYYNEMALRNIIGMIPTYMRPPFSECNQACSDRLAAMGYHVTYFDLDSQDYLNDSPMLIQGSKNIWTSAINSVDPASSNFLVIEHDIHCQTVYNLTKFMLQTMKASFGTSVTVGSCLGDPSGNWYRQADAPTVTCAAGTAGNFTESSPCSLGSTTTIRSGPVATSTDGSCNSNTTCLGSTFGDCCSQYSWCGSTDLYCGTGCQPNFGDCN